MGQTVDDLPDDIRRWLRGRRIVLKTITAHQVNQLHIRVTVPHKHSISEVNFVRFHSPSGFRWEFATGELVQAAGHLVRESTG